MTDRTNELAAPPTADLQEEVEALRKRMRFLFGHPMTAAADSNDAWHEWAGDAMRLLRRLSQPAPTGEPPPPAGSVVAWAKWDSVCEQWIITQHPSEHEKHWPWVPLSPPAGSRPEDALKLAVESAYRAGLKTARDLVNQTHIESMVHGHRHGAYLARGVIVAAIDEALSRGKS